jgi:signal transduction histidine kinase
MTNALKHADPRAVEIEVAYESDRLTLRVRDDGRGFDAEGQVEARPGHFGLVGMRERARKIAARLAVESTPGRGTTVEVEVARPWRGAGENRDGPIPDLNPGGG